MLSQGYLPSYTLVLWDFDTKGTRNTIHTLALFNFDTEVTTRYTLSKLTYYTEVTNSYPGIFVS